MPVVRMLQSMSGLRGGQEWPPRGGLLTVPTSEAADLVAVGFAEVVPDELEMAAVEPTETATVRRGPGRPRKTQ